MARDDFSERAKRILADRVGHLCSNPKCRASTRGPHDDSNRAVSVGIAAHITAAAPGGPRFDRRMSATARSSVANGIWLCQTHGKLVDNDEESYPAALLREWKATAESEADARIGQPRVAAKGRAPVARSTPSGEPAQLYKRDLEHAFTVWMVKHRGVIVGKPLAAHEMRESGSAESGRYDVRLVFHSPWWRLFMIIAGVAAAVGFIGSFGTVGEGCLPGASMAVHRATGIAPGLATWCLLLLLLSMFVVAYIGYHRAAVDAWIEYNELPTEVDQYQIENLLGKTELFRRHETPCQVMIVSGGGFSHDAIRLAQDRGIECYRRVGDGFVRVDG